ncbi:hypothetical protein ACWCPQ_21270 [Nocardia sp. NPDC001965]
MSDRSVEDQIIAETTSFAAKLGVLARQHAQARGWLGQRKVRREISLTMRAQRRAEQAERAHHLSYTSQMIHRYQIAAQARTDRALDPRIGIEQQRRDADADARHLDELRERIVGNTRLTQVERGIALDCLETARMWPHGKVKTPELLARAPKVRGVDALRYRARLARETAWVRERRYERESGRLAHEAAWIEQRRAERGPVRQEFVASTLQQPVREEAPQAALARPTGELTIGQADAIQKIRHAQLSWNAVAPQASHGEREQLAEQWRDAGRAAEQAGLTSQRIDWEFRNAEQNSRYTSRIHSRGADGAVANWLAYHPSEAEAAKWVARDIGTAKWNPGVQLNVAIHEHGTGAPVRSVDGRVEHVTARTAEWARPAQQREQSPEAAELASLKQRHHLSIEHNADLAAQNAGLTQQLTALRAERDQLTEERDRYKTERDEAVQKVVARTPAAERLGSPQRQAAQAQREPIPGHPFSGLVNGHDREREGMER